MADDGAQLLEELMRFRPDGLTANAWAVRAGVSRTIWSDLRRHGNPSRRTLSKLLEAAGSSLAEFEALRTVPPTVSPGLGGQLAEPRRPWGQMPIAPLPLLSTERGGAWNDGRPGVELMAIDQDPVVDQLPRPSALAADRHAYAITMVIDGMWPRYRRGRRLAVSPMEEIRVGDDVVVRLADNRSALVGELRSRGPNSLVLRQFNPPVEYEVAGAGAAHKVLGELF